MDPTDSDQKAFLGQGCMLTDRIVLTALHVVRELPTDRVILVSCPSGLFTASELWSESQADLSLLRLDIRRNGDENKSAPATFPRISSTKLVLAKQVGYMALLTALDDDGSNRFLPPTFLSASVSRQDRVGTYPEHHLSPSYSTLSFSGGPVFFPDGTLCAVLLGVSNIIAKQPSEKGSRNLDEFDFLFPRISPLAPHRALIEQFTHPASF
jgi:hypothetical protein